jgi:hypothetical protein
VALFQLIMGKSDHLDIARPVAKQTVEAKSANALMLILAARADSARRSLSRIDRGQIEFLNWRGRPTSNKLN